VEKSKLKPFKSVVRKLSLRALLYCGEESAVATRTYCTVRVQGERKVFRAHHLLVV
jgi:hypothetical protein